MKYSFCNNIYFVKGKVGACIYDFNNNNLYHFDIDGVELINKILGKKSDEVILSAEETIAISELLNAGVICYTDGDDWNAGDVNNLLAKPIEHSWGLVWIEVTKQCNLKCIHCYNESEDACISSMPFEDFKIVIDSLQKIGIKKIQLIGGEPMILGSHILEMLEYTLGKFEFIEVFTNGTLITDEHIKFFQKNDIHIALSIYSNIPDMHDKVTHRKGAFEKTITTIKKLEEHNIKYRLSTILMKNIDTGCLNNLPCAVKPSTDVIRLVGRASLNMLTKQLISQKLITKETFAGEISEISFHKKLIWHNCFGRHLYISTELDVFPCVMERRIKHGNLRNSDLDEIISQKILRYTKDKITDCKDCEYRYSCHDCRPDTLDGDINSKPWKCTYNPQNGTWRDKEEYVNYLFGHLDG